MGTFIVTFYLDFFWLRIGNQTWNVSCFEVSCSCTLLNPMGQSPPPLHSHHHSQRHHHHHHKYHEYSSSPILPNQINDHQFSFFVPSTLSPFPAASLFSFHTKIMFKIAFKVAFKVTTIDLRALKDVLEATERLQEGDHRFLFILRFSGC